MNLRQLIARGALIKPEELAKALSVSPGTVYAWIARGTIPYLAFGKSKRFDPADLEEWLNSHRKAARKSPGQGHTVHSGS